MKILLVDDHQMIIEALAQFVGQHFSQAKITTVTDRTAAMNFLKANRDCRVLVTDLSFHGKMEGYALLAEATEKYPHLATVVLSMHTEVAFLRKAITEGAVAYIVKTDPPQEICRAIESALRGERYLSSSLSLHSKSVEADGGNQLSPREREIAQLVRSGASSKTIGEQLKISARTVEVHRRNIMKKLNVHNAAQLVAALSV